MRKGAVLALLLSAPAACGSNASAPASAPSDTARADAPIVSAQPGAWFDAYGNLSIVGPGRRLRLVLSAPIAACTAAFERGGAAPELVTAASLPFHVLSEACREQHPSILLAEESETASPAELEHSYHEVARCAASDFGLLEGWVPRLVAESDPCPLALGRGWRLPTTEELSGLTADDRKAVAGALFDTEDGSAFGGLLLYAKTPQAGITLATLSPNAAEQPPALDDERRARPFFGAAVRCVRESLASGSLSQPPVLPHAGACLREQRQARGKLAAERRPEPAPEVRKLQAWLDGAERSPANLRDPAHLQALSALLASPHIERLANEARDERALTERYAELAESLDDPAASPGERQRRHAEFDNLRKRLGGQIVQSAQAAGSDRVTLAVLLSRLQALLEEASKTKPAKRARAIDYAPLLARARALSGAPRP